MKPRSRWLAELTATPRKDGGRPCGSTKLASRRSSSPGGGASAESQNKRWSAGCQIRGLRCEATCGWRAAWRPRGGGILPVQRMHGVVRKMQLAPWCVGHRLLASASGSAESCLFASPSAFWRATAGRSGLPKQLHECAHLRQRSLGGGAWVSPGRVDVLGAARLERQLPTPSPV